MGSRGGGEERRERERWGQWGSRESRGGGGKEREGQMGTGEGEAKGRGHEKQ